MTVRWRQGHRWREGRLDPNVTSPDGSLRIYDDYSGATRSLPVTAVQYQTTGPRGGRRWEWLEARPDPELDTPPPAWQSNGGKADLFNQTVLWEAER